MTSTGTEGSLVIGFFLCGAGRNLLRTLPVARLPLRNVRLPIAFSASTVFGPDLTHGPALRDWTIAPRIEAKNQFPQWFGKWMRRLPDLEGPTIVAKAAEAPQSSVSGSSPASMASLTIQGTLRTWSLLITVAR